MKIIIKGFDLNEGKILHYMEKQVGFGMIFAFHQTFTLYRKPAISWSTRDAVGKKIPTKDYYSSFIRYLINVIYDFNLISPFTLEIIVNNIFVDQ